MISSSLHVVQKRLLVELPSTSITGVIPAVHEMEGVRVILDGKDDRSGAGDTTSAARAQKREREQPEIFAVQLDPKRQKTGKSFEELDKIDFWEMSEDKTADYLYYQEEFHLARVAAKQKSQDADAVLMDGGAIEPPSSPDPNDGPFGLPDLHQDPKEQEDEVVSWPKKSFDELKAMDVLMMDEEDVVDLLAFEAEALQQRQQEISRLRATNRGSTLPGSHTEALTIKNLHAPLTNRNAGLALSSVGTPGITAGINNAQGTSGYPSPCPVVSRFIKSTKSNPQARSRLSTPMSSIASFDRESSVSSKAMSEGGLDGATPKTRRNVSAVKPQPAIFDVDPKDPFKSLCLAIAQFPFLRKTFVDDILTHNGMSNYLRKQKKNAGMKTNYFLSFLFYMWCESSPMH
jgi:hypothetical protein